jgi:two-component system sensor histidine kinase TctE
MSRGWIRLPSLRPGSGSLRRQLLLWLLLPQLVLWVVAAAINYQVSLRHASQAIDDSLALASRALARQIKPLGQGLLIDFPLAAQAILQADPQDPFYYMASTPPGDFILGYREMPARPSGTGQAVGETVFYDAEIQLDKVAVPVRVAALLLMHGERGKVGQPMLVQVARSSTNHRALARRILIDTVLPLSALIAMMSLIVGAGVKAGLAPLARLRALVEGRKPTDLAPLRLDEAPLEVRSLAGAINDLLAAVQGNLVAQRRFLNDAAHQLRTPLAGLKSQTEVALAEAADPVQKARLQRVHDSANRAAHLVAQLLALARADPEAASAIARAPLDLRALAREVTSEWVPRALHAGIDLGFDESNQRPCVVEGAALLLREAMSNVIDNAIRYAGSGAEVTVSVAADGAQAIFEVTDNGPGIPAGFRATVFDRFVRATDQGSGCGLGLAIVREVAQRHGGSAGLVERGTAGTTVQVRLPISTRTTLAASAATQR